MAHAVVFIDHERSSVGEFTLGENVPTLYYWSCPGREAKEGPCDLATGNDRVIESPVGH